MTAPRALRIELGARTGQPVIVSLDSTELGPALGGCRVKAYASWRDGLEDALADLLHAHGITWAPDPVVSAGGIIGSVAREIDHLAEPEVQKRLSAIGDRLGTILDESARSGLPPLSVARQRAEENERSMRKMPTAGR